MSGIIGGAGSKSGVIGVTEFDIEEGIWTPANGNFTTWSSPTFICNYVKVGRMVTCNFTQTGGNLAWSAVQYFTGLPFLVKTNTGASAQMVDSAPTDHGGALIWPNQIYMIGSSGGETSLIFSFSYTTDE